MKISLLIFRSPNPSIIVEKNMRFDGEMILIFSATCLFLDLDEIRLVMVL